MIAATGYAATNAGAMLTPTYGREQPGILALPDGSWPRDGRRVVYVGAKVTKFRPGDTTSH
jgi:hypothetical protein